MVLKDVVGVATAIIILAGLSVAILNASGTSQIIGASGNAFANLVNQATHPGKY